MPSHGGYAYTKRRTRFGRMATKARVARGLSQQHVADAVGLKRTTYVNIESGFQAPSVGCLKALVRVLRLDAARTLTALASDARTRAKGSGT